MQMHDVKSSIKSVLIQAGIVCNLFIFVVLFLPVTEILYKPLMHDDIISSSKYQAIVVLAAGMYRSGSPDYRTLVRLKKGQELYRQGKADKIICIGGIMAGNPSKSIAVVMKDTLVAHGIVPQDIFVDDGTTHTYNDISHMLDKFGKDIDFNSAIFVTSSYHTFRVKKILEKKRLRAQVASAEPYELYPHEITERVGLFAEVIREYVAVGYSWLKGWI